MNKECQTAIEEIADLRGRLRHAQLDEISLEVTPEHVNAPSLAYRKAYAITGECLIAAKARVMHGAFGIYLEEQQIEARTAQYMMEYAMCIRKEPEFITMHPVEVRRELRRRKWKTVTPSPDNRARYKVMEGTRPIANFYTYDEASHYIELVADDDPDRTLYIARKRRGETDEPDPD
jgi:hypothetical protein